MRRVILESPYGDNPVVFVAYARACLKDSLSRGEAPLASHLLYTQPGVLNDGVHEEREQGMAAGFEWYRSAEALVVYRDFGISAGMARGIRLGEELGLQIDYRFCPDSGLRRTFNRPFPEEPLLGGRLTWQEPRF